MTDTTPTVPEWQPIETAPKDGRTVWLGDFKEHDLDENDQGSARFEGGHWIDGLSPDWRWEGSFYPTHWMPLPPPPSQEQSK